MGTGVKTVVIAGGGGGAAWAEQREQDQVLEKPRRLT